MDGGGRGRRLQVFAGRESLQPARREFVVHPAVVLGLGHAVFEHQHLVVERGQAFELRVAGQAHQPLHPLAPCEVGGRRHFGIDAREQRFDAMAHVAREQGFLVGKVVVERADGNAGFERHGAGGHALPAVRGPNPNKGVVDRLHGELAARLRGAFQGLGAGCGGHRLVFRTRRGTGRHTVCE